MARDRGIMYVDKKKRRVVIEMPLDEAMDLCMMLPQTDGFTHDLWRLISELEKANAD